MEAARVLCEVRNEFLFVISMGRKPVPTTTRFALYKISFNLDICIF